MSEVRSAHLRRLDHRLSRTTARLVVEAPEALGLVGLRLPWFQVRNQDGDGPATVLIFDEIGGSMGVSAKRFVDHA